MGYEDRILNKSPEVPIKIRERQQRKSFQEIERGKGYFQAEFPDSSGFSATNLWYMSQFYMEYQGNEILQPLVGEISWTKHILIMSKCKDIQERQFYIIATKKFGWTKKVLIHQIENKSFEKYLLNQTNFNQTVPDTIIAFPGNQFRLTVDDEDLFIELLPPHTVEIYNLCDFYCLTYTNT